MAFLMISKSCLDTLMEQQFFVFFTEVFVLLTASAIFYTRAALYLNDWELTTLKSALLAGTSSLLNCQKLPDVLEYLSLYSINCK